MGMGYMQLHSSCAQKGPCGWGFVLCAHHLEIPYIYLSLCFVNEVQWDNGA